MEISGYATSARRLLAPPPLLSCSLPNKNPSSSLSSSTSLFFNNDGIVAKKRLLGLVSVRGSPNGGGGSPASSRRWRRRMGTCRCLFGLGVPELVVIAGVAALVFGPKQLPEIGRSIGKTIKSFQQAAKEFESELKREPEDGSQTASAEGLNAVGSEDKKKELDTSDPKENV